MQSTSGELTLNVRIAYTHTETLGPHHQDDGSWAAPWGDGVQDVRVWLDAPDGAAVAPLELTAHLSQRQLDHVAELAELEEDEQRHV